MAGGVQQAKSPAPRRVRAALLAGLWTLLALAGCQPEAAVAPEAVRPVRTQLVSPETLDVVGVFPGDVRPRVESRLAFQISGRLAQRDVQLGDTVMAGQALARVDPQDLELAEAGARAELAAAQVEASRTDADLQRYSRLRDSGFISQAEFDQRRAARDAAAARVAQARAGLKARANQSDYAVLRADADGVVTGVDAEVGQVVSAGQPVIRVARTASKEIAFQIPEARIEEVRALQQAQVELWAGGPVLHGRVREIAASADPATRAFPARLALADPPPSLRFGMTATVRFTRPMAEPAVRVPLTALFQDGQASAVWVLGDDARVRRVPVQLLTVTDKEAVIRAGLPAGAEIVTAGVHVLREGQPVKRLAAPQAPPPAGAASAAMLPVRGDSPASAPRP